MAMSLPVENFQRMWAKLSTTCSNLLKQLNGKLLVAVDHNQLRTMASETEDPIDWSLPPPSWAAPPELLVHSINRCGSATALIRSCNLATLSMRGNPLSCAAKNVLSKPQLDCQQTKCNGRADPVLHTNCFPIHSRCKVNFPPITQVSTA